MKLSIIFMLAETLDTDSNYLLCQLCMHSTESIRNKLFTILLIETVQSYTND
jgi:hypothetical protein